MSAVDKFQHVFFAFWFVVALGGLLWAVATSPKGRGK